MKITFTSEDYGVFLKHIEKQMKASNLKVSHFDKDRLYTSRFYVRLFDRKLEIVSRWGEGPRLEAPLDTFLKYCHGCNQWHVDFSEVYRMEGVSHATYILRWLDEPATLLSLPCAPEIDELLQGLLERLQAGEPVPPRFLSPLWDLYGIC